MLAIMWILILGSLILIIPMVVVYSFAEAILRKPQPPPVSAEQVALEQEAKRVHERTRQVLAPAAERAGMSVEDYIAQERERILRESRKRRGWKV